MKKLLHVVFILALKVAISAASITSIVLKKSEYVFASIKNEGKIRSTNLAQNREKVNNGIMVLI